MNINDDGVIGYYNKEPDIPTDYDAPEMAFLKKGVGFLTADDVQKTTAYNDKYGQYIRDFWDVHQKDILPQSRFLEILPKVYRVASEVPTFFKSAVTGQPLETILQLKFYVFNGLQQNSLQEVKTFIKDIYRAHMKTQGLPQFDNFHIFIQSFTYNYPYREAVITAVDRWKTHLTYLQKEILENLIILDEPAHKSYIKRLTLDCENHLKHAQVSIADLGDWLTRYQTDVWDTVDPHAFIKTELHEILASEPEISRRVFSQA